jgi:hypothetical protein
LDFHHDHALVAAVFAPALHGTSLKHPSEQLQGVFTDNPTERRARRGRCPTPAGVIHANTTPGIVDERPRVYDPRDRDEHDPRDVLMRDLDLPRGDERELVVDRDRIYELDGEDSRTLAVVGTFRVVPERRCCPVRTSRRALRRDRRESRRC